jgi:O-antigen/teichoic acid export membrane protein
MINRLKNKLYNGRLKGLFATDGTLSQKAARGGVWVFGSFLFSKALFFIQTIILVRLLAPEDFGLMGICYVAIGAMAVFTETGFNQALIQRKEYNDDFLNTAWVISVVRGVVLFSLLFFLSPVIAGFYENAQIKPILKVIAFSFLFYGFNNIGLILFSKELNFKRRVIYNQLTSILSIIATISLAFWLRNVWSLVIGHIAGAVIGTSLSYWVHPFKPKFSFKVDIAKELFHFGKWVFLSGIFVFFLTQGDDALVGKVLGISALGFYALAYKFSNLPATAITHIISGVSYPTYSKLQDNLPKLKDTFLKIMHVTAFLAFGVAGLIFIFASDFTRLILGNKWLPIVPAIMILVWWGVIRSLIAAISPIFLSIGKPRILSKYQGIQLVLLYALIYPLMRYYDIAGASLAVFLSALIMFFIRNNVLLKEIQCHVWLFYKNIVYPLGFATLSMLIIAGLKHLGFSIDNIMEFIMAVLIFISSYLMLAFMADRYLKYELVITVKKYINLLK